jgi:ribonuclease R
MSDFQAQILDTISQPDYQPLKVKALAARLHVPSGSYEHFRRAVKDLLRAGRAQLGKNATVQRPEVFGTLSGVFRRLGSGAGIVRPHSSDAQVRGDIMVASYNTKDASTGDEVAVRLLRKPSRREPETVGEVVRVIRRATQTFVGTFFEREGGFFVRVDGTIFSHSIEVGDPGAKGARPGDKVVVELVHFPSLNDRGEGVIIEVLGKQDDPRVDTLSVIRALGIPDEFPVEALAEARLAAAEFRENDLGGRADFTRDLVITIDPADARDFDDAVSLAIDPKTRHWLLAVHIADVSHFVPAGGPLDREARVRGTSVYLPQRVIPMLPEVISNNLASLQEGKIRYVKSVLMDFTPTGQRAGVRFADGAIRPQRRFTYEQVMAILKEPHGATAKTVPPAIVELLLRLRDFALTLRKRRFKHGALEMTMPEAVLEYDDEGRVTGAHFAEDDISHQIIEECMLAANEAVAEHLTELGVPFLRRVHPPPEPDKLEAFAEFAHHLGYRMRRATDRFEIQRVLRESAQKAERHAVHYALLRSLKQAVYSPEREEHFALASTDYCHFTSPIRRYPDLVVHRQLGQWLTGRKPKADFDELRALGEHCSKTERRAETAERELVRLRLLRYLEERLGTEMDAVITGVADYGFFAQGEEFPAEGLVHISTLADDYYHFDPITHSLEGRRARKRYRLGDRVRVEVVRVAIPRRQLDFRVCEVKQEIQRPRKPTDRGKKRSHDGKQRRPGRG